MKVNIQEKIISKRKYIQENPGLRSVVLKLIYDAIKYYGQDQSYDSESCSPMEMTSSVNTVERLKCLHIKKDAI